jgi:DNA-binding MarR family transcriptional regulator
VEQKRNPGDINMSILAALSNYEWLNTNQIAHKTNLNQARLLKIIDDFIKRKFVETWESLDEMQKLEERKRHIDADNGMYKITQLGYEKFKKIRDDCLDEHTKEILELNDQKINLSK